MSDAVVIEHALRIDAPPAIVWTVITDVARYGEWNPFVIACRSTLAVGDPIVMRVHVFPAFAQTQRETVLEHVPGERLCYGIARAPLGSLASRRCHELAALADGATQYWSRFRLGGFLAPVVGAVLGRRLVAGFGAMSAALKRRAEGGGGR